MNLDGPTLLLVGAIFALAGFVKGVIGLGLPAVGMGLLGLLMPPAEAAALLVLPSAVTNLWQLLAGPDISGLLRRLWPLLAGAALGTLLGSGWLSSGGAAAKAGLGLALAAYAAVGLARVRLAVPTRVERVASPVVGLATGLVTAATGVFVIPAGPYLQAIGLEKEDLIQALGLSFTVSTLALATVLWRDGALGPAALGGSCLALAPALIGMAGGTVLRGRVRAETFRLSFFSGLLLLGAYLAVSALA